jgi:hypothetical protein
MVTTNRFEAGKELAFMNKDIREASARITRMFKANMLVDMDDIDIIDEHIKSIRKSVKYWNAKREKELQRPVKAS